MGLKDIAKSGILGVGPALVADNPNLLRGMGLVGNIAANKLEDREEEKQRRAAMAAQAGVQPQGVPPVTMKKGGKVSSASKRADGCAIKGKTKGRMV
jgi:hypothetical protein